MVPAFKAALAHGGEGVVLFQEELSYYPQPSLAAAYAPQGHTQPKAQPVAGDNPRTRSAAVLEGVSGRGVYPQHDRMGSAGLQPFYARLRAAYPQAQVIHLVQDHWPVPKTAEGLEAAQAQGLTPLWLPTYASWLNPREKLWRWLKPEVLHLHRLAHDSPPWRHQVMALLNRCADGSDALLRDVGPLPLLA